MSIVYVRLIKLGHMAQALLAGSEICVSKRQYGGQGAWIHVNKQHTHLETV